MNPETFEIHDRLERAHWWFCARRHIIGALAARLLPPAPVGRILDIGCGTGANLAAFAHGRKGVGIDISPDAVAFASARYPGLDFRRMDESLPPAELVAEADMVFLCDVLEHVPEPETFLSAIVGAMRPGTHLLMTVPADMALWSPHDVGFGHLRRYDAPMLRGQYAGLPVRELLFSACNSRLYPAAWILRHLTRLRGRASGLGGTDVSMPPAWLNRLAERVFRGEETRLLRVLDGTARPYARGVSLIAILERTP